MTDEDVPSPIDLRDPHDAQVWADAAEARPGRAELRRTIAELVRDTLPAPVRVLELGSGPGWLAETVLATCDVRELTLFDFSPPFLAMCRARLGDRARYVLGDFTRPDWPALLDPTRAGPPFDAVVTMQAVHEVRHKRHAPALYARIASLLRPGGLCVVCDHVPTAGNPRSVALCSTDADHRHAFEAAGFTDIAIRVIANQYVCAARR